MMTALLLAMLAQTPAFTPQEAQALFTEANDAYYKDDFDTAIAKYQKLLAAGQGGADVLFNLGTAHLAKGELGMAVVYLERAEKIARSDDIEANLAVARQRQVDQVVGADVEEPFFQRLARALPGAPLSVAFIVGWYTFFLLVWRFRARAGTPRLALGLAAGAVGLLSLVLGAGVGVQAWVGKTVIEAVVVADTAKVHEFPADTARVSFEAHAGLKVRVMEESGKYARIRLPNALEGWMPREGLVEL